MRRKTRKELLSAGYALAVTYMIGRWAIHFAYLKRGYEAVGGEYFLIPVAFVAAYKIFEIFINALEEAVNGSKKRGSRGNIGMRNRRKGFR